MAAQLVPQLLPVRTAAAAAAAAHARLHLRRAAGHVRLCRSRYAHFHSQRALSSSAPVPSPSLPVSSASSSLGRVLPLPGLPQFTTSGSQIEVIYEPSSFYRTLLSHIRSAQRRIFLASLYIGKEESELLSTLRDALRSKPGLELHILVDALRSTREHPQKQSSASLLAGLKADFPKQVHISLYHTPKLNGLVRKLVPKRFNEGWGLWHGKVYGCDDTVIISGANLSRDYFTNRQDRYIVFRDHAPLADYFHFLLSILKPLSFSASGGSSSAGSAALDLLWPSELGVPRPDADPRGYTAAASEALQSFQAAYAERPAEELASGLKNGKEVDTVIQPFLQMGPFGLRQETDLVVPAVLRAASEARQRVDWTSGYFSLRQSDRAALLSSAAGGVSIVCAAPEANGFYQSAGWSYYIPPAYTYLERRFYSAIAARPEGRFAPIELREWKRPGWTYHAKGVWLSQGADPHLTLVGSTNYGNRSAERDAEVNVAMQTVSPELRQALAKEVRNINAYAGDKVDERLFSRTDRHVGWFNRLAARAIADML